MGDFDRQGRVRRVTAIALCLVMAVGLVLPSHAPAGETDRPGAHAHSPGVGAGHDHGHHHRGAAGAPEVSGHCSASGCFSALPSSGVGIAGPDLTEAGRLGEPLSHLSPALKRDPPVPRSA